VAPFFAVWHRRAHGYSRQFRRDRRSAARGFGQHWMFYGLFPQTLRWQICGLNNC